MDHAMIMVLAAVGGAAVAASAGLRAFLPLFAVGLAARFGLLRLAHGAEWMSSDVALLCLGTATALEIAGDKFPVVDHVLDFLGAFLRPLAASFAAYGVLVSWPSPWAQILALSFGAGAFALNLAKAKLRLGSSAVSLGTANPLLSALEDLVAAALLVLGLLAPLLALGLVVVAMWAWSRRRQRASAAAIAASTVAPRSPGE